MRVIVPIEVDSTNMISNVPEVNPAAYVAGTTYAVAAFVLYSNSIYKSLQAANTGNQPDTSPLWWAIVSAGLPAAYNAGTTYGLGDTVSDLTNHKIYESLQAANTGNALTAVAWWLDTGATNAFLMFDEFVNTQTEFLDEIGVTITTTNLVGGLALFELDADSVQVICTDGATEVYNQTFDLVDYSSPDYYEYFFSPYVLTRDLHALDIPPYPGMDVQIKIIYTGSTAKCGAVVLGQDFDSGATKWGPRVGIISFSRKIRDDFGRILLLQGRSSKRASIDLHVENQNVDYLQRKLASIDGIACAFVGDPRDNNFQSLTIYGFFRDFEITIPGPGISSCTIELEGLI